METPINYTDLLKQAQKLVEGKENTPCGKYVQHLTKLRADGKPFVEKETTFLREFVANPEKYECPEPPGFLAKLLAWSFVAGTAAAVVAKNVTTERRWRSA